MEMFRIGPDLHRMTMLLFWVFPFLTSGTSTNPIFHISFNTWPVLTGANTRKCFRYAHMPTGRDIMTHSKNFRYISPVNAKLEACCGAIRIFHPTVKLRVAKFQGLKLIPVTAEIARFAKQGIARRSLTNAHPFDDARNNLFN